MIQTLARYMFALGRQSVIWQRLAGKILLADMTADEIERVLTATETVTLADGRRISRPDLLAQLDKIRGDGNAVSISERLYGVASVAAAVRTPDDQLAGVLSVTGDAADFTESRIDHLIPEVRRAAITLGQRSRPHNTRAKPGLTRNLDRHQVSPQDHRHRHKPAW